MVTVGESVLAWRWMASEALKERPSIPAGLRIYAVGDVHGRADLVADLFARIDADLKTRPIGKSVQILLGDYIDRGPHSRQVIDLLIARQSMHHVVFLKGNHETYVWQFLSEPTTLSEWQQVGGISTLLSYGLTPTGREDRGAQRRLARTFEQSLPDSHRLFIQRLELSFTCGDFFFVHAGVRPGIPLQKQSERDLLWIRDDFLLHEDAFGKIVVHGHTPAIEPDIRSNRINIDTGAYATGRLTCLVLEGNEMSFL
jgi:serine/threonine protein phosphatase 1